MAGATDDAHVRRQASGPSAAPALVLLGGADGAAGEWQATVAALSDRFNVLAPDINALWPAGSPDPLAGAAAALAALLDERAIERVYLCGHGFGGLIALAFAVAFPRRLHGLILVDTTPEPLPAAPADAADVGGGDAALVPLGRPASPGFMARLEFITTPTLVVAGEADAPFLQRGAELLHGWIPFSRLVRIPHAAHRPQVENPAAFVAELDGFLREMEAARAEGGSAGEEAR